MVSTPGNLDHGGGLDLAIARYGGTRIGWADLSTGVNSHSYPIPTFAPDCWQALPDSAAMECLLAAARAFWSVPDSAHVLAAPGASLIIAQVPGLRVPGSVVVPGPTYNEHAASFAAHGWRVVSEGTASARVIVQPNNPDGRVWSSSTLPAPDAELTLIDESFCDITPAQSFIREAGKPGWLILKSFGKFWGLAGLRLGFAIGASDDIAHLRERLGPWAVSGPALETGTLALSDDKWAAATRIRLAEGSAHLDALMQLAGARVQGGTSLFRLYNVDNAESWQDRLAQHHIWSRTFPYNPHWLRLGIPHSLHWPRLKEALA
ncbi:MAG: threonine-phosphate decarboxylase [Pseudomonadota bacterium]